MGKNILLGQSDTLTITGANVAGIAVRMDTVGAANNVVSAAADILMDKIKITAIYTHASGRQFTLCSGASNVLAMASTIGSNAFAGNTFATKGIIRIAAGASAKENLYKNVVIWFPVPISVGRGERLDITVTSDTSAVTAVNDASNTYINFDVLRSNAGSTRIPFVTLANIPATSGSFQSSAMSGVVSASLINKNVTNDLTASAILTSANVNSNNFTVSLSGNGIDAQNLMFSETDSYNYMYASVILMPVQDVPCSDVVVNCICNGSNVTSDNNAIGFTGFVNKG